MDKNELQVHLQAHWTSRFGMVCDLIGKGMMFACVSWVIWVIFTESAAMVKGMTPEAISAVSKLFETYGIGTWLGYVWGGGATILAVRERKGKKRAISQKSKFQKLAENADEYRSVSGLTETGETPK